MTRHTFDMSEQQANNLHKLIDSHCSTTKNHVATAVERGKLEYAQKLVAELREYQALFAAFNMTAKHEIAEHTGKALVTAHRVEASR